MRNTAPNTTSAGWPQVLMAGTVAGGLLLVPVVQAEDKDTDTDAAAAAPAAAAESPATPAACPPPPPCPFTAGAPAAAPSPQFRPEEGMESGTGAYPPGIPSSFPDDTRRGGFTRQEFLCQQEERRKQMEKQHQEHQAEMHKRVEEKQKRMDEVRDQR